MNEFVKQQLKKCLVADIPNGFEDMDVIYIPNKNIPYKQGKDYIIYYDNTCLLITILFVNLDGVVADCMLYDECASTTLNDKVYSSVTLYYNKMKLIKQL